MLANVLAVVKRLVLQMRRFPLKCGQIVGPTLECEPLLRQYPDTTDATVPALLVDAVFGCADLRSNGMRGIQTKQVFGVGLREIASHSPLSTASGSRTTPAAR